MKNPFKSQWFRSRRSAIASDDDPTVTLTHKDRLAVWQKRLLAKHWRFALSGVCAGVAALAVASDIGLVNLWERQLQSLFFELRGPIAAPENIVILAIDEESLLQGQHYLNEPERYQDLEPVVSWPWKREAYAKVIERVMDAGAEAVAIDILFTSPSIYGEEDDERFTQTLEEYGDRIVLAADYSPISLTQGNLSQPSLPLQRFTEAGAQMGSINFRLEPNNQIHRLGEAFLAELSRQNVDWLARANEAVAVTPEDDFEFSQADDRQSFAQATLDAADVDVSSKRRENIFFYGPSRTFEHIPFWYVLDDGPWRNKLRSGGAFKDRIVVIGTTATVRQDFHAAPFSQSLLYPQPMAGVEILANTIATLEQDRSPSRLIKRPFANAVLVFALGLAVAALMNRTRRHTNRALLAAGCLVGWGLISYGAFVGGQVILLTGTPMAAIAAMGVIDFGLGFTAERVKRKRLRTTLARYATSPLVQEIISQQDDLHDLLESHRANIVGSRLRDHYLILEILGSGGFGETYLAQDTLRPGNPVCVVKQLKIVSDNPKSHHLARRLFEAEARVLGDLGEHNQIPRLLAYFSVQQSFYLVQEMVQGQLLRDVLSNSRPLSQKAVVKLLKDLLPVINFVHSKNVIHRDIKPSNIIRRHHDKRYVLIDFGAVKTISSKIGDEKTAITSTVGIGTQGYMPSEQSAGMPNRRSDLYALGITAIEALTGRPPHALKRSEDGEIIWAHMAADISPELSRIINKMVRFDFNKRYAASEDVLSDLCQLNVESFVDEPETMTNAHTMTDDNPTLNQGPRTGVIETNEALDKTAILPSDWVNKMETKADPPDEEA